MKKINIYIHTLGGGGAELALINMVNNLDKEKYEITVTTIINTGKHLASLLPHIKVDSVLKLPKFILNKFTTESGTLSKSKKKGILNKVAINLYYFFWKYMSFIITPIGTLQNVNEDIVISYLEGPTQIFVSNLHTKALKIAWVHVDLSVEKKSEKFYRNFSSIRNNFDKFDRIVSVSKDVELSLTNYIGVSMHAFSDVIYNVYDDENIRSLSNMSGKIKKRDKLKIVSVGRLSKQKGYDRLLKAAKIAAEKGLDFELNILGDGEDKDQLADYIINNRLDSFVNLVGFVNNPYEYIYESDVFFSSSRTEGYSTVVVESLILGIPIIATDCSGMSEILDDGNYGLIINNNEESIVKAFLEIIENDQLIGHLQQQVKQGMTKYSMENAITKVEDYFDSLGGKE